MLPFSDFYAAKGSFVQNVQPVFDVPTDEPLVTICVNANWLPLIAGCLKQLLLQATWGDIDPDVLFLEQELVFTLIGLFNVATAFDGCATTEENWFLEPIYVSGTNHFLYLNNVVANKQRFYVASMVPDDTGTVQLLIQCDIDIEPYDTGYGGKFETLAINGAYWDEVQPFLLTTVDCLGNVVVSTPMTPYAIIPGEYKTIDITATTPLNIFIHTSGDWTCGPS